jgi:phage gpG-like protein
LITPVSKASHLKIVNKKKILNKLFYKKKHMNKVIVGVRRKVESLYSWVKQYFLAFSKPFYKNKKQYDNIVKVTFTCYHLIFN